MVFIDKFFFVGVAQGVCSSSLCTLVGSAFLWLGNGLSRLEVVCWNPSTDLGYVGTTRMEERSVT